MKIASIDVNSVLGIRSAAVQLSKPVALFAAPNGNGKTSLAEAVRMALGGDVAARGVKHKKDLQALVHEGNKDGLAEVQIADGALAWAQLPSGKTAPANVYTPHPMLPFVMEPERFAQLDEKERRTVLFDLLGLQVNAKEIVKRLVKRGIDQAKAERVGPLLRAGFQTAEKEAREKATQAKGAWRQVTGETYGSEKAKDWRAPVPEHDAAAAKNLATELQHADVALEQWQQAIGKLQAEEQRRTQLQAWLPALREHADKIQRIQDKLTADESGLTEWEQRLQATEAEAGAGTRVGNVHDLAKGLAWCLSFENKHAEKEPEELEAIEALKVYEREHGKIGAAGNPEAQAKLPEVRKSRDLMANAVANGRRDLAAAQRAAADLATAEEALAEEFDAGGLANARSEAQKLKDTRADLVKKLDALKVQKAAADAAERKTEEAATHHADVEAWTACADALAPTGIPGEMLAEALGPFNERLAQAAADAQWVPIRVTTDMEIETAEGIEDVDGRPYKLLSESERWRADAMLAEAIGYLSGLKFLMLDRFDVLDLAGRSEALTWLQILAENGELDTGLVFATLKTKPAANDSMDSFWLEAGEIAAELAQAA